MCDLLVIGAGAGGFAAALSAARLGLRTVLVERADVLGGNAVRALVCSWEPGVGGTGVPLDLYRRLGSAAGIARIARHQCSVEPELRNFPGCELRLDPALGYGDTLRRFGASGYDLAFGRRHWHAVSFLPEACATAMAAMLAEAGVTVLTSRSPLRLTAADGRITTVTLDDGSVLHPRAVIDASAEARVAELVGCALRQGRECAAETGEPSAPEQADERVNGVSLLYRITPCAPTAAPAEPSCWWAPTFPVVHCVELPDGDRVLNMLPTMAGADWLAAGPEAGLIECRRRLDAHWRWLQAVWPEFRAWRIRAVAPAAGVRESRRIVAERLLDERDVRGGLAAQRDDDLCTIADHALDTHGHGAAHGELAAPYGVPFRCLVPVGMRNLLVACRAAGFTAIAASSCRLTRTMMQLGQAAGTACALAPDEPAGVAGPALRAALSAQGVQLAWPPEPAGARLPGWPSGRCAADRRGPGR